MLYFIYFLHFETDFFYYLDNKSRYKSKTKNNKLSGTRTNFPLLKYVDVYMSIDCLKFLMWITSSKYINKSNMKQK